MISSESACQRREEAFHLPVLQSARSRSTEGCQHDSLQWHHHMPRHRRHGAFLIAPGTSEEDCDTASPEGTWQAQPPTYIFSGNRNSRNSLKRQGAFKMPQNTTRVRSQKTLSWKCIVWSSLLSFHLTGPPYLLPHHQLPPPPLMVVPAWYTRRG